MKTCFGRLAAAGIALRRSAVAWEPLHRAVRDLLHRLLSPAAPAGGSRIRGSCSASRAGSKRCRAADCRGSSAILLEVARSLVERTPVRFNLEKALALWLAYNRRLLALAGAIWLPAARIRRGRGRLQRTGRRLWPERLGCPARRSLRPSLTFFESRLRHHRARRDAAARRSGRVYGRLRDLADHRELTMPTAPPQTPFDLVHVGKCGGSSIVSGTTRAGAFSSSISTCGGRWPAAGHRYVVLVRDPVARVVSAFNWRRHLLGNGSAAGGPQAGSDRPPAASGGVGFSLAVRGCSTTSPSGSCGRASTKSRAMTTMMHLIGHVPQGFAWYLGGLLDRIEPGQLAGVDRDRAAGGRLRRACSDSGPRPSEIATTPPAARASRRGAGPIWPGSSARNTRRCDAACRCWPGRRA